MKRDRLADLTPHRHQRVERRHRLLKDHRDVVAADCLHLVFAQIEQIGSGKTNRATNDPPRRVRHKAQD